MPAASNLLQVPVVVEVALGRGQSGTARVDAEDRGRSASSGGQRETTSGTEHVEDSGASAHPAAQTPVVPLVQEVSGLLADHDIGLDRQPVLAEQDRFSGRRTA